MCAIFFYFEIEKYSIGTGTGRSDDDLSTSLSELFLQLAATVTIFLGVPPVLRRNVMGYWYCTVHREFAYSDNCGNKLRRTKKMTYLTKVPTYIKDTFQMVKKFFSFSSLYTSS